MPHVEHSQLEVKVEGHKKSRKWRDRGQMFFTFLMVVFTAFETFMAGYNVAKHYYAQATADGILAVAFAGLVLFQVLDMAMDAKFGREAMRLLKSMDGLFEAFAEMASELADAHEKNQKTKSEAVKQAGKLPVDPKKRARMDRENARRRAARAAKKNVTPKKTDKK